MPNNNQTRKIQELGHLFDGMNIDLSEEIVHNHEASIQMGDVQKSFASILSVSTTDEDGINLKTLESVTDCFVRVLTASAEQQVRIHTSIHKNKQEKSSAERSHRVAMLEARNKHQKEMLSTVTTVATAVVTATLTKQTKGK
jgi:hypothetical protein